MDYQMQTSSAPTQKTSIAVILSCFNRKDQTIACMEAVMAQTALANCHLSFYITDDGSVDGTAEALLRYPGVKLLLGDGSLFWNGGMRLAWGPALLADVDFFLWLNDDTLLFPDALASMLACHARCAGVAGRPGIVVGSTCDENGRVSYGGERQAGRLRPLTLRLVAPKASPQSCDTFNGNCVLIPRRVARVLGNLEPGFVHAMGDTDYGLRARRAGIPVWIAPHFAGRCRNDGAPGGSFRDVSLPLRTRMAMALSPKGLPWRAWALFCRRHAGLLWPLYWAWPYLNIVLTSLPPRRTRDGGSA